MSNPDGNATPGAGKPRVLIVDDAPTIRGYHADIATKNGWEVELATDGQEGIEKATEGGFDLYLVDVNMPRVNGYQFVSAVRQDETARATPAAIISTEGRDVDRAQAFDAGANFYFVKPVRPEELGRCLTLLSGEPGE